ncbi:uncharacterized protein BDZ83DRAFT_189392 [Colletotrichum acutatum]|uniref:Cell surface protein n=1 Tax=Glomerella acutata TaxID=27357 RepID=A0AAD8UAB4_GLOAC|nr:uncharacterized protein BDZ83DRAFT_189392 [Colletotrichum acutatum]KAK1706921.1 hypothetical protein BDZ83DRAFT_189392 [Colletotrichum acutatum]
MGLGAKIKNALHSDDHPQKTTYEGDQPPGAFPSDSTTTGTSKHTTGGYTGGTTGTTGSHVPGTTGTSTHHTSNTTTGYNDPDGVHGPHAGRVANKADPRVDSDRDHRDAPTSGLTGNTYGTTHGTTTGHTGGLTGSNTAGYSNTTTGYNDPDGVHGPHGGRAANKLDPRVDSDRDHRGAPTTGLTGSNTYDNTTGTGHAGGLHNNPHGTTGSVGGVAGNTTTGYNDPDGVHGPHSGRAANKLDPRVDSDRDHRGAPGAGLTGTHRPHDSGVEVGHGVGHNKPYKGEYLANAERTNAQDPYWGDVGRDGSALNTDLPLRPNESAVGHGGPQAVGGGHYNPAASTHHDPASSVDRSMEGRDFTHPHSSGAGVGGAGSDPYSGVHSAAHNPQAALSGGNVNDPYDTRMRDRDMGRERTGHGAAGAGIGAGVGAGAAVAAGQAAHRHRRDDLHESGLGGNNTVGSVNSSVGHNTHGTHSGVTGTHGGVTGTHAGGVHDHHRSSLTGNEPGVPKTSMLDPYNESPTGTHGTHGTTHSNVASTGLGGNTGSSGLNQGTHSSHVPGTTGLGPQGMGPDHYGPGHDGAKVFHTCTKCGEDNDISRYFKKDAVYRMN